MGAGEAAPPRRARRFSRIWIVNKVLLDGYLTFSASLRLESLPDMMTWGVLERQ